MESKEGSSNFPSIETIYNEASRQVERQSEHVDAIDTKASILLGFLAAVIASVVALERGSGTDYWLIGGVILAFVSFIFGIIAYWPRTFSFGANPRGLRENYPNKELEATLIALVDNQVTSFENNEVVIKKKLLLLKIASIILSLSLLLFLISLLSGVNLPGGDKMNNIANFVESDDKSSSPPQPAPQPTPNPPINPDPGLQQTFEKGAGSGENK